MIQIVTIASTGLFKVDHIDGTLGSMWEIVGGHIEPVLFEVAGGDATLWLNEEGKLKGLGMNALATALVRHRLAHHDRIVGDVFITGGVDGGGVVIGLTNRQVDALVDRIVEIAPAALNSSKGDVS